MAWSNSKVFAYAVLELASKAGQNLSSDSYKGALYTAGTPDNTVATAALTEYNGTSSQWVTGNEASGTNYTAGGAALSGVSLSQSGANVSFVASNLSWANVTLTGVVGILVYDTTVSNEGLCYNYFGGTQSVTGGTFTVQWNGSGVCQFQC